MRQAGNFCLSLPDDEAQDKGFGRLPGALSAIGWIDNGDQRGARSGSWAMGRTFPRGFLETFQTRKHKSNFVKAFRNLPHAVVSAQRKAYTLHKVSETRMVWDSATREST